MNNITNQLSGISYDNKAQTFSNSFLESGKQRKETNHDSYESIINKIHCGLEKIDRLRLENFNLKKQIAYDKKKYLDLKNAFIA